MIRFPWLRLPAAMLAVVVLLSATLAPLVWAQGMALPTPKFQAFDNNGRPCSGCLLYVYLAGTTTPQQVYSAATLAPLEKLPLPVVLDSAGRANIYTDPTIRHKYNLRTAAGADIWTIDNVNGPLGAAAPVVFDRDLMDTSTYLSPELTIRNNGGVGLGYRGAKLRLTSGYDDGTSFDLWSRSNGTFTVGTLSADALIVDSLNHVMTPAQPAFSVRHTADVTATADATVAFTTEDLDVGGHFAANAFTAPVAGPYQFCATVSGEVASGSNSWALFLDTPARDYRLGSLERLGTGFVDVAGGCVTVVLAAADAVSVSVREQGGTPSITIPGSATAGADVGSVFSGRLLP